MYTYNECDHIYSFGNDSTSGCLWLGDYNSAKSQKIHREKSIKTVITAGLGMELAISEPIKHLMYPLCDSPAQNIENFFQQAYQQIEEGLKNGNVLIHCFAGVSRSSTIVISYLMKKCNWSFRETLEYVRKKRCVVNPNQGFAKQLKRYETKLKMAVNQVEKPEKNQSKSFVQTARISQKDTGGFKTYSSMFSNASSLQRGRSLDGTKPQPKNESISLVKK